VTSFFGIAFQFVKFITKTTGRGYFQIILNYTELMFLSIE